MDNFNSDIVINFINNNFFISITDVLLNIISYFNLFNNIQYFGLDLFNNEEYFALEMCTLIIIIFYYFYYHNPY